MNDDELEDNKVPEDKPKLKRGRVKGGKNPNAGRKKGGKNRRKMPGKKEIKDLTVNLGGHELEPYLPAITDAVTEVRVSTLVEGFRSFTAIQQQYLTLMVQMGFHKTAVCNYLGINRKRPDRWGQMNPKFRDAENEIREYISDLAESILIDSMKEHKDPKIAMFILRTLGRKRGYGEATANVNVQTNDTGQTVINIIAPKNDDPMNDN